MHLSGTEIPDSLSKEIRPVRPTYKSMKDSTLEHSLMAAFNTD